MDKQHIVIVLSTHNKKESIIKILTEIWDRAEYLTAYRVSILVVDDISPEETASLVNSYIKYHPKIYIFKGKKNNNDKGYIHCLKYAIQKMNADILIEMDADSSHHPADIPQFIQQMNETHSDFVIGSNYNPDRSMPANWSFFYKITGKLRNIMICHMLGITHMHNVTGEYRAIRTSILRSINLEDMPGKKNIFQLALLYQAIRKKAHVTGIPLNTINGQPVSSKIRFTDIIEFIPYRISLQFGWIKGLSRIVLTLGILLICSFLGSLIIHSSPRLNLIITIAIFSVFMITQSSISLYWMLYAWDKPEKAEATKSPVNFLPPNLSFTAIIPARHETNVIVSTIKSVADINYPEELKQIIIVCRYDDRATITSVENTIAALQTSNIKLMIFYDDPVNKPHALNVGLKQAENDIVVIFDAEDEPHADIFHIANTIMQQKHADVLQSGVQLMNYRSSWFSSLNVLEYFFWFKSALHFFADAGIIPLGGNTVFIKRKSLEKIHGWDEKCLTEDADIGIRLSTKQEKICIVYDEKHVTKEESPLQLSHFMKQRTRWNQGFLQVLFKKNWLQLPSIKQKILAGYILLSPLLQALLFLYLPFSIFITFYLQLPVWLALLSVLPFYILVLQILTYNIGLYLFTKDYHLPYNIWFHLALTLYFLPFQLILGISALRALIRYILKIDTWEKTHHANAHRISAIKLAV